MHTLVLLRHAKAEPDGPSDIERELARRGHRQAAGVGADLAVAGPLPDLVLVSAATRTRQTWEGVAAALPSVPSVLVERELYDGGPRQVLERLRAVPEQVGTVLVVGHEPVMSQLAARLASAESDADLVREVSFGIPTATRCVLQVTGEWAELTEGGALLTEVVRAPED